MNNDSITIIGNDFWDQLKLKEPIDYNYQPITLSNSGDSIQELDLIDLSTLFADTTFSAQINNTGAVYPSGNTNPWYNTQTTSPPTGPSYNYPYTVSGIDNAVWTYNQPSIKVQGDAEFDGDIKLRGKSLSDILDNIEARLGILHPNPELEEKWEELKALSVRYKELEKDIIEKEKLWSILKK